MKEESFVLELGDREYWAFLLTWAVVQEQLHLQRVVNRGNRLHLEAWKQSVSIQDMALKFGSPRFHFQDGRLLWLAIGEFPDRKWQKLACGSDISRKKWIGFYQRSLSKVCWTISFVGIFSGRLITLRGWALSLPWQCQFWQMHVIIRLGVRFSLVMLEYQVFYHKNRNTEFLEKSLSTRSQSRCSKWVQKLEWSCRKMYPSINWQFNFKTNITV